VVATAYSLAIMLRAFHGPNKVCWKTPDLSLREMSILSALIVLIVWLGLYPQPVFATFFPALQQLIASTGGH